MTHRKIILLSSAALVSFAAFPAVVNAQASKTPATATTEPESDANTIIVTGTTSKNRRLITSSADVTLASAADIVRKAARSTAELLELVPGIYVEGTAGNVSNNYSVRGLPGGSQQFVSLQEDGMPIIYGGGGADEYFAPDINVDRLEAVKGGSSGVLNVNGAGATINFITKKPNFDHAEGMVRIGAASYGEKRADVYYSAPLGEGLAFSVGGYFSVSPGVRKSPYNYDTYHVKAQLSKKFDNGGTITLSGKIGDQQDAYYADQPLSYANGQITSVPGLNAQYDNIGGSSFGQILIPDSCATGNQSNGQCLRAFQLNKGIEAKTKQLRLDVDMPVSEHVNFFLKSRYLGYTWDFNGLFAGSGSGAAGLASGVNYLTPGSSSPINGLYTSYSSAHGTPAGGYGLKDLTTGKIYSLANTAELNSLNGNGLIQQTWLNHDYHSGHDWGTDAGLKFETKREGFSNSLTVGLMYYKTSTYQDQSAVAHVINDVSNDSHIYDVVALDKSGQAVGTLTDNGLISYGDWGVGINYTKETSISPYFNDELKIGDKLRIDFGLREEFYRQEHGSGNQLHCGQSVPLSGGGTYTAPACVAGTPVEQQIYNAPVPSGTAGVNQTLSSTFNGTYTVSHTRYAKAAYTLGANYLLTKNISVYARYAQGFQDNVTPNGSNTSTPTTLVLYEAGARYGGHGINASATVFKTVFKNRQFSIQDTVDTTKTDTVLADISSPGLELDFNYKANAWFGIDASGVFQNPKYTNFTVSTGENPGFNNNVPQRTPKQIWTITPQIILPDRLGEIYVRVKHIGPTFADDGNNVVLNGYTVTTLGGAWNVNKQISLDVSVDNLFNVLGATEGNPRQGLTQSVTNGTFYGRTIVGTNGKANLTFKF